MRLPYIGIAIGMACFVPNFRSDIVPVHDAMARFQVFFAFYAEYLHTKELILWVPYGSMGITALPWQLQVISPIMYVVGLTCAQIGVTDTLLVYKIVVLGEISLFMGGLGLFADRFIQTRPAQWLAIISGACLTLWSYQPWFNFSIFYLFPLIFYFLWRFFVSADARSLSIATIVFLVNAVGNVPYFLPLQFFVILIISVVLWIASPKQANTKQWVEALRHPEWIFSAVMSVVLIFAAYLVATGVTIVSPDRRADFGVSMDTYLNYGRLPIGWTLAGFMLGQTPIMNNFSAQTPIADNSYYVGLLPLLLFTLGLFRKSISAPFLALASAALILIGLSAGGVLAKALYFFPGFPLYRHIGLVFGLVGLLIILGSSFVIDQLLAPSRCRPVPKLLRILLLVLTILVIGDYCYSFRPGDLSPLYGRFSSAVIYEYAVIAMAVIVCIALTISWRLHRQMPSAFGFVLGLAVIVDVVNYQIVLHDYIYARSLTIKTDSIDLFKADLITYQSQRTAYPDESIAAARLTLAETATINASYDHPVAMFTHFDSCYPGRRLDTLNHHVYAALLAGGADPRALGPTFLDSSSADLFRSNVVRRDKQPLTISLPINGVRRLVLSVDAVGKKREPIFANWINPTLVSATRRVSLSSFNPARVKQNVGEPQKNFNAIGGPLRVGQKTFFEGIGTYARSRIEYILDENFDRFETAIGVDDATTGRGGAVRFGVGTKFIDPDEFAETLGCGAPKWRLYRSAVSAHSDDAAAALLREIPDPRTTLVVIGSEGLIGTPTPLNGDSIQVRNFSNNEIVVGITVAGDAPAYLFYADGFDSAWRASIDGEETVISRGQVGFKAIRIPPGNHVVVLRYGDGILKIMSTLLALIGITGLGMIGFGVFASPAFRRKRRPD